MERTLLIVDDSRLARMFVARLVAAARSQWSLVEASNADEAMAIARTRRIDGATIDFNMPGRDGLKLAAELKSVRREMPVAILSANYQADIVAAAAAIPALFIPKPLKAAALDLFLAEIDQAPTG